ncbi:apolipoprotein D [Parasteatoda tepidariorum]|uniref:apolipoprotein D n=1 Tax=Parasteatoda tepidariorum TaxID=114398 RepID=UPI00077F9CC7|nr:apolipoprotein D [Parasteatoda tepidariorum]
MFKSLYLVLYVCLLFVTVGFSQRISAGECPDVTVKKDFDVSKYVGQWYEFEKNPAFFENGLKCNWAIYRNEGDYISVNNSGVNVNTGVRTSINGKATIPDKNVPAKLKVQFDTSPKPGNYWVLDTDYEKYSVVYACSSIEHMFKAEFLWILSRTPVLDDKTKSVAYDVMDRNSVSREGLFPTVQDCYGH